MDPSALRLPRFTQQEVLDCKKVVLVDSQRFPERAGLLAQQTRPVAIKCVCRPNHPGLFFRCDLASKIKGIAFMSRNVAIRFR